MIRNGTSCISEIFKKALSHCLRLEKVDRVIDKNTKFRKNVKSGSERDFFKLMSNAVFGKTMEGVGRHRSIKLAKEDKRRNLYISEPHYIIQLNGFQKNC